MAAGRPNGARSVGKAIKSLDFDSTEVRVCVGVWGGWRGGCVGRRMYCEGVWAVGGAGAVGGAQAGACDATLEMN